MVNIPPRIQGALQRSNAAGGWYVWAAALAVLAGLAWLVLGLAGALTIAALAALAVAVVTLTDWPGSGTDGDRRSSVFARRPRTTRADSVSDAHTASSLLDAMPDPAILIDRNLVVRHANPLAQSLFPALRTGASVTLASRQPELAFALEAVLAAGTRQTVRLQEVVPVTRLLDANLAPLPAGTPGEAAILMVLHDVSERERLNQMRSDFIAHASHELRTPLASIKGFVETLQGAARDDPAARERFLGIMHQEAERMNRLLDDLLSLSRIEMHAHIVPTTRIRLADPLDEVEQMMAPLAAEAGTTLEFAPENSSILVRGDRDELVQVFANLVQNAIKYGRQGGRVSIAVSQTTAGGRPVVHVAVADDGPGIAARHLPRLTERFYRVDDRKSRAKGGTGLGLAIVKHIVNRHGGELKIRSIVGKGSVFTVELPVAAE